MCSRFRVGYSLLAQERRAIWTVGIRVHIVAERARCHVPRRLPLPEASGWGKRGPSAQGPAANCSTRAAVAHRAAFARLCAGQVITSPKTTGGCSLFISENSYDQSSCRSTTVARIVANISSNAQLSCRGASPIWGTLCKVSQQCQLYNVGFCKHLQLAKRDGRPCFAATLADLDEPGKPVRTPLGGGREVSVLDPSSKMSGCERSAVSRKSRVKVECTDASAAPPNAAEPIAAQDIQAGSPRARSRRGCAHSRSIRDASDAVAYESSEEDVPLALLQEYQRQRNRQCAGDTEESRVETAETRSKTGAKAIRCSSADRQSKISDGKFTRSCKRARRTEEEACGKGGSEQQIRDPRAGQRVSSGIERGRKAKRDDEVDACGGKSEGVTRGAGAAQREGKRKMRKKENLDAGISDSVLVRFTAGDAFEVDSMVTLCTHNRPGNSGGARVLKWNAERSIVQLRLEPGPSRSAKARGHKGRRAVRGLLQENATVTSVSSGASAVITALEAEWHRGQRWASSSEHIGKRVLCVVEDAQGYNIEREGTIWGYLPSEESNYFPDKPEEKGGLPRPLWRVKFSGDILPVNLDERKLAEALMRARRHAWLGLSGSQKDPEAVSQELRSLWVSACGNSPGDGAEAGLAGGKVAWAEVLFWVLKWLCPPADFVWGRRGVQSCWEGGLEVCVARRLWGVCNSVRQVMGKVCFERMKHLSPTISFDRPRTKENGGALPEVAAFFKSVRDLEEVWDEAISPLPMWGRTGDDKKGGAGGRFDKVKERSAQAPRLNWPALQEHFSRESHVPKLPMKFTHHLPALSCPPELMQYLQSTRDDASLPASDDMVYGNGLRVVRISQSAYKAMSLGD